MLGSPRLLSASALTSSTSHCSQHKLFKSHFKAQPGNPSPPGVHITFQNGLIILGTGAYLITAALQKGFQSMGMKMHAHSHTHLTPPHTHFQIFLSHTHRQAPSHTGTLSQHRQLLFPGPLRLSDTCTHFPLLLPHCVLAWSSLLSRFIS